VQTAIDFVARCLSGSALAALGGIKFKQLTDEEYKELENKDPSTFYIVTKGNKQILYIGTTTISSGVAGGNTIVKLYPSIAISADMEEAT
jgi:hypothetical protein